MTSKSTQLEIAAQWLEEAAIMVASSGDSFQLRRVAADCLRVAKSEKKGKK